MIKEIGFMKKALSFALVIVFVTSLFSGCGDKNEPPDIIYNTEILINQEIPQKDLTWYVDLDAPTRGISVIDLPSYSTYATLDTTGILQTAQRDYRNIIDVKINDTVFRKRHDYTLLLLGMTEEEYDRKINKYFDPNGFYYYSDRVIGIIYPIIYQGETEELIDAEYSNKNILVDYDYESSVVIAYTDEDLKSESKGMYFSSFTGRVGDRYYLPYGYYDLTDRVLCPYKEESDLPPFKELLGIKNQYDLLDVIKNDINASAYIPDDFFIESYALVENRYCAIISGRNRLYGESIDEYEGDDVFLVTVDASTGNVIYLQKTHLGNYWGFEYKLCTLGDDGILYDVDGALMLSPAY